MELTLRALHIASLISLLTRQKSPHPNQSPITKISPQVFSFLMPRKSNLISPKTLPYSALYPQFTAARLDSIDRVFIASSGKDTLQLVDFRYYDPKLVAGQCSDENRSTQSLYPPVLLQPNFPSTSDVSTFLRSKLPFDLKKGFHFFSSNWIKKIVKD
jgi:hypothetical protein